MGDRAEPLSSSDQQPTKPIRYLKDGVLRKKFLDQVNWVGEKRGGCFRETETYILFNYGRQTSRTSYSHRFDFDACGGREAARAAAEVHQREMCRLNGWIRNEFGFFTLNGVEIGVVKLNHGKYMLFDRGNLNLVTRYTWFARRGHRVWYAVGRMGPKVRRFHSLILPNAKIIDHLDHEGTNNLVSNLEESTSSKNSLNSRKNLNNTAGYKGISYARRTGGWWCASVMVHGKRYTQNFSCKKHGNKGAFDLALAHRNCLYKEYNVYPDDSDDSSDNDTDDIIVDHDDPMDEDDEEDDNNVEVDELGDEDLLDIMLPLEKDEK